MFPSSDLGSFIFPNIFLIPVSLSSLPGTLMMNDVGTFNFPRDCIYCFCLFVSFLFICLSALLIE